MPNPKSPEVEIKRGEVYRADLDATIGSEMKYQHLAVVVSANSINKAASVVIICPITDAFGKYSPVHIEVNEGEGGTTKDSVVHCGQVRAIDKSRLGERMGEFDRMKMAKISKGLKDALDINM